MGVFIGIQVSNWDEARIGAAQQEHHIERLSVDSHAIKPRIDSYLVTFKDVSEGTEYLQQLPSLFGAEYREFAVDPQRLKATELSE